MKVILAIALIMSILFPAFPAFAKKDGEKGADDQAYEHADEEAKFKREEDWFDKTGKKDKDEEAKFKTGDYSDGELEKGKKQEKKKDKESAKKAPKEAKKAKKKSEETKEKGKKKEKKKK